MKIDHVVVDRELETKAPRDNEAQAILRAALDRLGPNGERWFQGSCRAGDLVCAVTALGCATKPDDKTDWLYSAGNLSPHYEFLWRASGDLTGVSGPERLNDSAKSFSEVRAMFHRAIALAGQS